MIAPKALKQGAGLSSWNEGRKKASQLLVFPLPAKLFQGADPGRQSEPTGLLYVMLCVSLGPRMLGRESVLAITSFCW